MKTKFVRQQKKNSSSYRRNLHKKLGSATVCSLGMAATALAQNAAPAEVSTNVTNLGRVEVIGRLDRARDQILPEVGASTYTIGKNQIQSLSQGDNAPMNQVILRAPGVAQDTAANGDLHVRGEHANLQYRINGVLLPEGINGFGLELDPRFVDSLQLITGSLPAQYGFRTAGVVDIHTKSGAFEPGGQAEMYGGSHDTLRPSGEFGGSSGKLSYFVDGSYEHNNLGVENVTASANALHDTTDQGKTFAYLSYLLSDTARLSFIGSASYANYQIPLDPTLAPTPQPNGNAWVGAAAPAATSLNDYQNEQNYYGVVTYQKSEDDVNLQVSAFGRNSSAHYVPENVAATLDYNNGVATDISRTLYSGGLEADGSDDLNDQHTLRGGLMLTEEAVAADANTTVFDVDANGNALGALRTIAQGSTPHALFYGMYLQDEWKLAPKLTLNYGTRFDWFSAPFDTENQVSPRANLVYQVTKKTTLHAGYSRYFTPPPLETVPSGNLAAFNGTTAEAWDTTPGSVKAERANYFDAGVTHELLPGLSVGLDAYYKRSVHQLDDGLFGQSLILSSFNYTRGRVGGVEFTGNYTRGGFSTYANIAVSVAQGEGTSSAQFLWANSAVANYVNSHWIALDHDQHITGSFGTAYVWKEGDQAATRLYLDALYGTGLRQDGAPISGDPNNDGIPNGSSVPAYYSINCGVEQAYQLPRHRWVKARVDVVNLTDNIYQLRSGSGVGVNAAQYGARLGFFGSLSYTF